jgi:hypothetical protein
VRAAGVGNWDEIVRVGGWDVGRQPRWCSGSRPTRRSARSYRSRPASGCSYTAAARLRADSSCSLRSREELPSLQPRARQSAARVRDYGATAVFDYYDPGWPARVRTASPDGHGVGAAVNTARGGAAAALQAVTDNGRLATITGDRRRPNEGSLSPTSRFAPTVDGLPPWSRHSPTGCYRSTSARHSRSPRRQRPCTLPSPAAPRAQASSPLP